MKQMLQAYLISIFTIIILSLLVSLIIGTLFFFHITDTNITTISVWILGILLYAIAGFIFGHYTSRKILIHLLVFSTIFLLLYFILTPYNSFTFVRMLCKILAFTIGTISIQKKKGLL